MSRKINKAGLDLVKEMEGFRADAYRCPAGVWTIGYGHTGGVKPGDKVTRAQAEELLRTDLEQAGESVTRLITVPLGENQFAALVSFAFNAGEGSLSSSTLRKKLNAGDYGAVPSELNRWVKARNPSTGELQTLPGLLRRRAAEGELWLAADGTAIGGDAAMPQKVESTDDPAVPGRMRAEVVARSGLRLRGGPGLEFDAMRTLPCGTIVYTGRQKGDWIETDLEGDGYTDGWAYGSYLRPLT